MSTLFQSYIEYPTDRARREAFFTYSILAPKRKPSAGSVGAGGETPIQGGGGGVGAGGAPVEDLLELDDDQDEFAEDFIEVAEPLPDHEPAIVDAPDPVVAEERVLLDDSDMAVASSLILLQDSDREAIRDSDEGGGENDEVDVILAAEGAQQLLGLLHSDDPLPARASQRSFLISNGDQPPVDVRSCLAVIVNHSKGVMKLSKDRLTRVTQSSVKLQGAEVRDGVLAHSIGPGTTACFIFNEEEGAAQPHTFRIGEIIKIIQKPSTGSATVLHSRTVLDKRSDDLRLICRWFCPAPTSADGSPVFSRQLSAESHTHYILARRIIKCVSLVRLGPDRSGVELFSLRPEDLADCRECVDKYVEAVKTPAAPAPLTLDSLGDLKLAALKFHCKELGLHGYSGFNKAELQTFLANHLQRSSDSIVTAGGGAQEGCEGDKEVAAGVPAAKRTKK